MNNFLPKSVLTSVLLHPSPTRAIRRAAMRRFSANGSPVRAVVQLDEQAKETTKVYTRRYCVVELSLREKDRVFRVIKPAPDHWEPYYCCLSAEAAVPDMCDCVAFEKSNWCSHVEWLRALIGSQPQKEAKPCR